MAFPVTIGGITFATKDAARDFIRTNVIAAFDGAPRIPAGRMHSFVDDLLNLHPDAVEKIGSGVDHFRVDPASNWRTGVPVRPTNRTLVVVRTNGQAIDWSWDVIIKDPSALTQKRTALRNAAYSRIQALKRTAFALGAVTCARTGLPIASLEDAQIRYHRPTFAQLTDGFAATVGGWPAIITSSRGAGAEIADPLIEAAWLKYYDTNVVPSIETKH